LLDAFNLSVIFFFIYATFYYTFARFSKISARLHLPRDPSDIIHLTQASHFRSRAYSDALDIPSAQVPSFNRIKRDK